MATCFRFCYICESTVSVHAFRSWDPTQPQYGTLQYTWVYSTGAYNIWEPTVAFHGFLIWEHTHPQYRSLNYTGAYNTQEPTLSLTTFRIPTCTHKSFRTNIQNPTSWVVFGQLICPSSMTSSSKKTYIWFNTQWHRSNGTIAQWHHRAPKRDIPDMWCKLATDKYFRQSAKWFLMEGPTKNQLHAKQRMNAVCWCYRKHCNNMRTWSDQRLEKIDNIPDHTLIDYTCHHNSTLSRAQRSPT